MTDDADNAGILEEQERMYALAHHANFELETGKSGECDLCGDWSGRLVNGICVPCRNSFEKHAKSRNS